MAEPDLSRANLAASRPSRWWYLAFVLLLAGLFFELTGRADRQIPYSAFLQAVQEGRIVGTVEIGDHLVKGKIREKDRTRAFETVPPPRADVAARLGKGVAYTGLSESGVQSWLPLLLLPLTLLVLLWLLFSRNRSGSPLSTTLHFGKHRARIHHEKDTLVSFADVAGVDEAVEEVREIVEYLKSPERFEALGGRIPRGVLLVGMPGTGKTLLARAVAGEASVPFLSISGADFVEMFVGVGASRVRDLFAKAKELAPCIIFIDELDALGRARGATLGGSEEREQTLNQLLVAMDGFSANASVIVLAATNRPEVLDQALLRPGRFDRQVVVDRPDVRGRLAILKLHTRNIKLGRNVDLAVIARRTPGFTGADLATVVNEAALLAARRRRDQVGMAHIEEAIDRVLAGLERRSRLIGKREKAVVSVHECGHAFVACLVPHADPLHRVSVIPRGVGVGGMTLQIPREDKRLMTRSELLDRIAVLLGGRVAEQILFHDVSTGAADDLRRATELAYRMVSEFGMSDRLGAVCEAAAPARRLFDRSTPRPRALSDRSARELELEVRRILAEQEQRVRELLDPKKRRLAAVSRVLRDKETLDAKAFRKLLEAPFRPRAPSSETR